MIELFDNQEDFQTHVPVNASFELILLKADLDQALREHILPYVSREQFDASVAITESNANFSKHQELIGLIKSCAGHLALAEYLPTAAVQLEGDSIIYTVEKSLQASSEDKHNLALSLVSKGHKAVDQILEFLESNKTVFSIWAESEAITLIKSLLIRNVKEYQIINNKRTVFLRLRPYILDAQFDMSQKLKSSIFQKLLTREWPNEAEAKALWISLLTSYVQVIIRNRALASALTAMAVVIDRFDTVTVFSNTTAAMAKGYMAAQKNKIDTYKAELLDKAAERERLMNNFLDLNKEAFGITDDSEPIESKRYWNDDSHSSKLMGTFR